MAIKIIVTGGTIDKVYDESSGELTFTETHLMEMLEKARCEAPVSTKVLMLVDSLDMDENDRNAILKECINSSDSRIVITHGTDTMVETAKILGNAIQEKTIVLFGAMVPFALQDSDGLFNLGSAIIAVQCLPHGVYITMNGKIFTWNNVRKNKEKGIFEENIE